MDHFKLVSSSKASDVIPVKKYVSQKTGLTVIIAEVEGPVVNGFFCLATEAHDDDGLPHTLEHLIFLGSQRYPYKGVLDLLANRCMADGTNAWTDVDHTCYTIGTVGSSGMLSLLPIYLDHILHPTLTDHGFVTEVHHIDGEGEDAGVVYCEMQGRENNADSRCELALLRAMYPNSGYSSETGGIMANLRTSTTNVKVRDYHKKFYRAENLTIILTGQIEAADVFKALSNVEDDILDKRKAEGTSAWEKPWQNFPPPPNCGEYKVEWPADVEDCGQIWYGWRGPSMQEADALRELAGCALLLRYLCETATAPLQRRLVEIEDPLVGDVTFNITENLASMLKIGLENVPIAKLSRADSEARACLQGILDGEEKIDMERMRRLVQKQLRESLASLESDPHHAVAFRCIGDALYSVTEEDFVSRLNPQVMVRSLQQEGPEYWLGLLRRHFARPPVVVVGSPSKQLQTRMAEEEKARVEKQRNDIGPDGLLEKEKALKEAIEYNERPPPPGVLESVPVPSCENLKTHSIQTWATDGPPCPHFDLSQVPLYTRLHTIKSNFVYIHLILDLTSIEQETRKWLPLVMSSLGECAVRRGGEGDEGGEVVPHETVVADVERLTVNFSGEVGFNKPGNFSVGMFGNFACIEMQCEPAEYEAAVNLLWEILYSAQITKDRLLVFAQRLINDVSQQRRNGHKLVSDTLKDLVYGADSNVHWCSMLRQRRFLQQLVAALQAAGDGGVVTDAQLALSRVRAKPWLHIAADFERNVLTPQVWSKFRTDDATPRPPQLFWDKDLMVEKAQGFVVGVGGLESNFALQLSAGPLGCEPALAAPVLVALEYFTQLEGPMWKQIRGAGLSYGYGLRLAKSEGRICFSLYRATNLTAAYTKAKAILDEYLSSGEFEPTLFESARSTALFSVVQSVKTTAGVVRQSLLDYLMRATDDHMSEYIRTISCMSMECAAAACTKWLPSVFDPAHATLAVVCHPSKVHDTQAAFQKLGIELTAYESIDSSHFNKD